MALRSMKLLDGRVLGFREYGLAGGFPVLFLHGNLNSCLFQPCWEKTQAVTVGAGTTRTQEHICSTATTF
jgi:hypothetical protein